MNDHLREHPGIKRPYFPLPNPIFPQKWKCIQLQIPDHDDWNLLFREALRTVYGRWFNWERDDTKNGSRVARMWQHIETTIKDCGDTNGNGSEDDCECEPDEDIYDAFDVDSIEDLAQMYLNAAPMIGQIIMAIIQPTAPGWLKCDGSTVNQIDYPQLFDILEPYVTHDATTFNLPDFRARLPIGVHETGGEVHEPLQMEGSDTATILIGHLPAHSHEIPEHDHTSPAHTHTQAAHNHTQDAHNHTQNSHAHNQNPHTHGVTQTPHNHDIPVRLTSAVGAQAFVTTSNNSGTQSTIASGTANANITIDNATAGNQGTTATNQPAIATNQPTTATNNDATVTINPKAAFDTSETGLGSPMSILNPVIGVHYFIFAGGNAAGNEC